MSKNNFGVMYNVKRKKMAKGGKIKLSKDHEKNEHLYKNDEGTSKQGHQVRSANRSKSWANDARSSGPKIERAMAKDRMEDAKDTAESRADKERKIKPKIQGLAEGGMVKDSTIAQARANDSRRVMPIKHPRMVPSDAFSVRLRDEEDDLQSSAKVNNGPQEQPPKRLDEKGANRQGPSTPSLKMKMMAEGGSIEEELDHQEGDMMELLDPSADEGESMAKSLNEVKPNRQGPDVEALHMKRMADGGEVEEDHHDSIAAAIMARRNRLHAEIDSGAHDMDHAAKMAEGGEILSHDSIYSDDSDQADLSRNADEDANEEDQLSFNALRKENYSESEGLDQLDSPMDSAQHGDEREDTESDKHDKIEAMRRRMNVRRQFKAK